MSLQNKLNNWEILSNREQQDHIKWLTNFHNSSMKYNGTERKQEASEYERSVT